MSPQNVKVDIIDNYPDWMSKASTRLANTRLCDLPLPGSHDAGAFGNIDEGSKAQGLDIKRQLECGFRYFDFRVCVDDGVFYAVHGGASTNNNYCAIPSRRQDALKDNPKGFVFEDIL